MIHGSFPNRLPAILAVCVALVCHFNHLAEAEELNNLPQNSREAAAAGVIIEPQTLDGKTLYATRYSTSRGDCTITWIAYNTEIDRGVVKHQPDCAEALVQQLPLLAKLLASFLGSDRNGPAFRTLYWGTLDPDKPDDSREMSFRLALAASQSPSWDKARGKPKNGDINRFVRDLANRVLIYPELAELFAHFQRTITLSHAEKVRVQKASKLPFFDHLGRLGVKATDRLPFDCMAWFSTKAAPRE